MIRYLLIARRTAGAKMPKNMKIPTSDSLKRGWDSIAKPAQELFREIPPKSPAMRNKVFIPFGNVSLKHDKCFLAAFEKNRLLNKNFDL